MADEKPLDPSAQFQDYVTQWERSVDQFFNQLMGTEQFSQSMNQLQKLQLEFQKTFHEAVGNQLVQWNLPSREEVLQLGEQIRQLDSRMARIESALATIAAGGQEKKSGPPRTRKPPSARKEGR